MLVQKPDQRPCNGRGTFVLKTPSLQLMGPGMEKSWVCFAVYFDELSTQLRTARTICYVRNNIVNHIYSVLLMNVFNPNVGCFRHFLNICC